MSDPEHEALVSSHRRQFADLRLAYERVWCSPDTKGGLDFRRRHAAGARPGSGHEVVRRWAVAEPSVRPTRYGDVPRFDDAGSSPLTAQLVLHAKFMNEMEGLTIETGRRLACWFGSPPRRFDWMVVCGVAPQIGNLGYWFDTAAWSAALALECAEIRVDLESDPVLPKLWSETIVSNLKWEVAAARGLTVPRNYRPPRTTADHPFALLENPFRPILDLWACGVMLATPFLDSDSTATLFVHGKALAAGIDP